MRFEANNELALHVPDPVAAERFYVDVLGCRVTDRADDCISLANGALRIYLLRDPARTHEPAVPSFDVDDRAASLDALQQAGCTLVPIGPHAPTGFYVRDPFGVLFDIVERPARPPRATAEDVVLNASKHQFELRIGDDLARLVYRRKGDVIDLLHTEVPKPLEGRGMANALAQAALDFAAENALQVIPSCPFVRAWLKRHETRATIVGPVD